MADMLSSMNDGATRVAKGKTVIESVNDSIHKVGTRVDTVTEKMVEVSSTVKQQAAVVSEVSQNIAAIANMTGEVLKSCEKVADGIHKASGHVQSGLSQVSQSFDADMLVLVTKADHASFKKRIIDKLVGIGDATSATLADHHTCRLGKWYDSLQDQSIKSLPAFTRLAEPHARVHAHGKKALELYEMGDIASAFAEAQKLDQASYEVIDILEEIHKAIKDHYS